MANWDMRDLVDIHQKGKAAQALKDSAFQHKRIADAQQESARAAQNLAKAEAEAVGREARASEQQVVILQRQHEQEIALKNAKSAVVGFYKGLCEGSIESQNLTGQQLMRVILIQDEWKSKKNNILFALKNEGDMSTIEKISEMVKVIHDLSSAIDEDSIFKEAKLIGNAVKKCESAEIQIEKANNALLALDKKLIEYKFKVIKRFQQGDSLTGNMPTRNEYVELCKKHYNFSINKYLRIKLATQVFGSPLIVPIALLGYFFSWFYSVPLGIVWFVNKVQVAASTESNIANIRGHINEDMKLYGKFSHFKNEDSKLKKI